MEIDSEPFISESIQSVDKNPLDDSSEGIEDNHPAISSEDQKIIDTATEEETAEEEDDVEITLDVKDQDVKVAVPVVQAAPLTSLKPKGTTEPISTVILKPSDLDDANVAINFPYNIEMIKDDKPWKKAGSDISDYFNYGFNEETWKIYCEKQRRLRIEAASYSKLTGAEIEDTNKPLEMPSNIVPPPMNFGIQIPPSILNMPPELASSIASIAASSLGLSADFVSNLPPIPGLMPTVFCNTSIPPSIPLPVDLPVIVEEVEETIEKNVKKNEIKDTSKNEEKHSPERSTPKKSRKRSRSRSLLRRNRQRDTVRRERRSRSRNRSSRRTRR